MRPRPALRAKVGHRGQRVVQRVAGAAGTSELQPLEERVASLEVAVVENARLAVPLERLVADVERAVAETIARSGTGAVGT